VWGFKRAGLLVFTVVLASGVLAGRAFSRPGEPEPVADSLSVEIERLSLLLRTRPNVPEVHLALARAYHRVGNLAAARASAEAALAFGTAGRDSLQAALILADVAFQQGRTREATLRLRRLARDGRAPAGALHQLAELLWADRSRSEALAVGMEGLGRGGGVLDWRTMAEFWKGAGRPEMALHLWRVMSRIGDPASEDLFQSGFLAHRLGQGHQALDAYARLLQREPEHPEGNYNVAVLLRAMGDAEEAARHLERAICGDPGFQPAYLELADIYLELDRPVEARRVLQLYRTAASPDSTADAEAQAILRALSGSTPR
jgi:tetratricopeptide (TPR) repeat protein